MPLRQYIIEYKAFLTLEKTLVKLDDLHRLHRLGRFRLMDGKPSTLNGNCFVRIPAPRQPCHLFGKSLVSDFVLLSATGWYADQRHVANLRTELLAHLLRYKFCHRRTALPVLKILYHPADRPLPFVSLVLGRQVIKEVKHEFRPLIFPCFGDVSFCCHNCKFLIYSGFLESSGGAFFNFLRFPERLFFYSGVSV